LAPPEQQPARLDAARPPPGLPAPPLLELLDAVLVVGLHLLHLLLQPRVAILQLLDLARQIGERLLELIEAVFDIDRVSPALCRGRRGQGEGNEEDEPGWEDLHDQRFVHIKRGHFQAWPARRQMKTPVA
jgi:hypothetical protein